MAGLRLNSEIIGNFRKLKKNDHLLKRQKRTPADEFRRKLNFKGSCTSLQFLNFFDFLALEQANAPKIRPKLVIFDAQQDS